MMKPKTERCTQQEAVENQGEFKKEGGGGGQSKKNTDKDIEKTQVVKTDGQKQTENKIFDITIC